MGDIPTTLCRVERKEMMQSNVWEYQRNILSSLFVVLLDSGPINVMCRFDFCVNSSAKIPIREQNNRQ